MKKVVAILLSGGIDSLTAGYLLKQNGIPLVGIHFLSGYEAHSRSGPGAIRVMADQIGIPVQIADCRHEFEQKVVRYFARAYRRGETPNPCLICNPAIKFGTLFSEAQKLGADRIATGHYARIRQTAAGDFQLLKGIDRHKDQSYFLAFLTQFQLKRAVFPLGEMTKPDVKKLAREKRFEPLFKDESQDVCFIRGQRYADFLEKRMQLEARPGEIVDVAGNHIGEHAGLHRFTIGQRRGINCPAKKPYYVVRLEPQANRLVVGFKADLFSRNCRLRDINWPQSPPGRPIQVMARVRYRSKAAAATFFPETLKTGLLTFDTPQEALTPGQGAVLYQEDIVFGAGWITAPV